jgi:hypothetical protein
MTPIFFLDINKTESTVVGRTEYKWRTADTKQAILKTAVCEGFMSACVCTVGLLFHEIQAKGMHVLAS